VETNRNVYEAFKQENKHENMEEKRKYSKKNKK
jgi:hypothetical protein